MMADLHREEEIGRKRYLEARDMGVVEKFRVREDVRDLEGDSEWWCQL
jgi:hypothetical protein